MVVSSREAIDGQTAGPLAGLRLLEVAGPLGDYCGKLFAGLGADVILIEPPGGCARRHEPPFVNGVPGPERSLAFAYLHADKRGVTLDLDTVDGQALFRRLAATADVIVESEPVGTMARRGLDYADLAGERPSLVYTSITPFGREGPYAEYKASDLVLLGMGGLLYLGGYRDGEPIRAAGNQAELAAGQFAANGSMLAVLDAEATGQGQLVDVSAQECVVMAHETAVQYYDCERFVRRREGGTERRAAHGIYPCKDGDLYLLVGAVGQFWGALVAWLEGEGVPWVDTLREPRWQDQDFAKSAEGRAEFRKLFLEFTMQRTKAELYESGKRARLPICPVSTPADISQNAQLESREFFAVVDHGSLGVPLKMPGPPFKLSATPWRIQRPAPALGQHNAEVFAEVGLAADDLAHLSATGVI